MSEPNDTPDGSPEGSGSDSPDSSFVTESQLERILNFQQLRLKSIAYDTLDGDQKINLLTIRTLGIVYSLVAVGHLFISAIRPDISMAAASASLQSILVIFAALYGLIMLFSETVKMTMSSPSPTPPPSVEEDESAANDG